MLCYVICFPIYLVDTASPEFQEFGLKPAGSVVGYPTMVKKLSTGRVVGYSMTHIITGDEWVATFPIGYADGYWRQLSSQGVVIRDKTGE
jgi:alanine racemase